MLVALAGSAQATFTGRNGKLAFTNFGDPPATAEQVFTVNPAGTERAQIRSSTDGAQAPQWSPDGTRIAFNELAMSTVTLSSIGVMNEDGSDPTLISGSFYVDLDPAWSPDGTRIAFSRRSDCGQNPDCPERDIYTMRPDGSDVTQVTHANGLAEGNLDWSPDGTKIAFSASQSGMTHIYTVNPDGTGQARLTSLTTTDDRPSWSPDGTKIAFHSFRNEARPLSSCTPTCNSEIYVMNRDGSGQTRITNEPQQDQYPVWSPDGAKLAFMRISCTSPDFSDCTGGIHTMNIDGSGITPVTNQWQDGVYSWQALPVAGYPRPRGASPLQVFLTPAFKPCAAPNRTHGAPLAFPSCAPPAQTSNVLTVGTPDSNGLPASALGSVRFAAVTGNSATAANEADVKIAVDIRGVLLKNGLVPYTGEVSTNVEVRLTDRYNSGAWTGTVDVFDFPVTVQCSASVCAANTTANALVPGAVLEGNRSVWELGQVEVYDGGPDRLVSSTDNNTLFMKQGILIP